MPKYIIRMNSHSARNIIASEASSPKNPNPVNK